MTPVEAALAVTLVTLAVMLFLLHRQEREGCPECTHCTRLKEERIKVQLDAQHDAAHRGFGWDSETDKYPCPDLKCPRNARLDQ